MHLVRLNDNGASPLLSGREARRVLPVGRTTLSLGMSDDEVLNFELGTPQKITRNKATESGMNSGYTFPQKAKNICISRTAN
jgi:hypothetical protein